MEKQQETSGQASDTGPRPISELLGGSLAKVEGWKSDVELAALAVTEERRRRLKRVEFLENRAGGRRMAEHRFTNWETGNAIEKANVKAAAQEWASTFPDRINAGEGLVLYGPCGTGKDHLAFAAVRQVLLEHGATADWQNGRDLMGEVRDRIGEDRPERALIRQLETPDVLVISDPLPTFGPLTVHQADTLYRIIENRYADRRLTVVTINVANDDEADSRLGAATWDRICDRAWKAFCNWPSYRKPAREIGC